jgi:hypothetical protein
MKISCQFHKGWTRYKSKMLNISGLILYDLAVRMTFLFLLFLEIVSLEY